MQRLWSKRSRLALAASGVSLVAVVLLASWLVAQQRPSPRVCNGPPSRSGAQGAWDIFYRVPRVTANGVTLAGKNVTFAYDEGIFVEFWLLVPDPALLDSEVHPVGVSLHSKETDYTFKREGALLAGGGIHFAEASFSGYDYLNSHPNIPGRNKELVLSIKALEVLNPDGSVQKVIEGPWETVVAVRSPLPGNSSSLETLANGEPSQSQYGVTVQLRPGAGVGFIEPYEVVQEGKPTRFMPLGAGPRLISQEEYESALKNAAEMAAKGPHYNWPTAAPTSPDSGGPSGPMSMGSQTGNAIVEVGSASIPQGQQAQVAVTIKGVNDPDGLGAYTFNIVYNPSVVNVVGMSGGQAPFSGTPTYKADNTTGQVTFAASYGGIPGPTGDIIVAYVTLRGRGPVGSTMILDITITGLVETARGDTIPAVDQDGTVTIVP